MYLSANDIAFFFFFIFFKLIIKENSPEAKQKKLIVYFEAVDIGNLNFVERMMIHINEP